MLVAVFIRMKWLQYTRKVRCQTRTVESGKEVDHAGMKWKVESDGLELKPWMFGR